MIMHRSIQREPTFLIEIPRDWYAYDPVKTITADKLRVKCFEKIRTVEKRTIRSHWSGKDELLTV